jgi:uncharacterized membrane protein YbhN (UPF0104 family)
MISKPLRKHAFALSQALLGAGLLTYLFMAMPNREAMLDGLRSISGRVPLLLLAMALGFNCLLLCTLRWWLLLRAYQLPISFMAALRDYLIGHFFNAFMLGSVGGDAIKAILVAKPLPGRRTEAVSTIVLDRIMGLTALLMLASTVMVARYRLFTSSPKALLFLFGAIASLLLLAGGWWLLRCNIFERHPRWRAAIDARPLFRPLTRLYTTFRECLSHPGLVGRTLLLSVANHLSLVGCALALGLGLGIRTAQTLVGEAYNYLTLFPVINGIASLPLTPGGLGTREMTTRYMMGLPGIDVDAALAVTLSLLLYAVMLFWSMVGGVLYIMRGRLR